MRNTALALPILLACALAPAPLTALDSAASLAALDSAPGYSASQLWQAIGLEDVAALQAALAAGADPNTRDQLTLMTPLMTAERHSIASTLLAAGSDPRAVDRAGLSILHHAVQFDDASAIVPLLLAHGAEIDPVSRDASAVTPLFIAVEALLAEPSCTRRQAVVAGLVARGADVDARNARGETPLMLATLHPAPAVRRLLLGMRDTGRVEDGRRMAATR